jgi:hypothetical protein
MYEPDNMAMTTEPEDEATLLREQKSVIEEQIQTAQETLSKLQLQLDELSK